ncbi:MAG: sodium/proton-translocating pyrophosphatase, partial [Pseudomonadota bacterium]
MQELLWAIIGCGLISIVYAVFTINQVMSADAGTAKMQEIAGSIQEGAAAYLNRQYTTVAIVGVIIAIAALYLGWQVAVGFIVGAVLSGAAGYIGMNV